MGGKLLRKTKVQRERSNNLYVRATTADTKVCEERGAGIAPGTGAPATHSEDHGEAGFLPADMEVHGGAEIHLQTLEDPTLEQVDASRRL